MNLYKLYRMVSEGDMSITALRYLLDCKGECEHLDYKEEFHLNIDHYKANFARDVIAMKNTGGGYILIGVEDKTWIPLGLKQPILEDTKQLRDAVRKVTGLTLEVDIVKHIIPLQGEMREFAVILVRGSAKRNKRRTPSVCGNNFCLREDWGIRIGDIYFRRGDQTVKVQSQEELDNLIFNLNEAEDLSAFEQEQIEPSPFLIEEGLYRILPPEYETFIDRLGLQETIKKLVEGDIRIWIVNVHGPGGVGKSALVSWLARHYYENNKFEAILHLSAKETQLTEKGIRSLSPTLYSLENLLDSILYLFSFNECIDVILEEKKDIVQTLLSDYHVLLILDNMETVNDGRIMQFISDLPSTNKSKVLLTSRYRTSQWERPLQINALNLEEVKTFLQVKSREKNIGSFKDFDLIAEKVHNASGGLALAIEWILGQYALRGDINAVLSQVPSPDSPLLEFSFNNSWNFLSRQSQKALAVLSIFEEASTLRLWATSLGWPIEILENAIAQLIEVTFVYERTDEKTGQKTYHMLPITRAFARNKLARMGDLELTATTAYQRYIQQMSLIAAEMQSFNPIFENYNVDRDTEKQAIILAHKAQAQINSFNYDDAEQLYKEALNIDPRSVFVLVRYAVFKRDTGQVNGALDLLNRAKNYITKDTAFIVYYNISQVYDRIKDRTSVEINLRKALEYKPDHMVARHQLGVVVSRVGRYKEALEIFDKIIQEELLRESGPTPTLLYAYRTKIISLVKDKKDDLAAKVLEEAKAELIKWPHLADRISELKDVL